MALSPLQSFAHLVIELHNDVCDYLSREQELQPLERRAFVRAVFALIEGATYAAKQYALVGKRDKFTTAEQAMLKEEEFYLDEKGNVHSRNARVGFLPNVRLGFAAIIKGHGVEHLPSYGGQGWESLRRAVKIRDRLMHPKKAEDLEVSDEEMEVVSAGNRWYDANMILCLKNAVAQLDSLPRTFDAKDEAGRLEKIEQFYVPRAS